jgi:hypothetical protein
MNPRLMMISKEITLTLKNGEQIVGHCNFFDRSGREMIVRDGADWKLRWVPAGDIA